MIAILKKIRRFLLCKYYGFNRRVSIGKNVRIVNPQYILMGENVVLDDGCELCVLKSMVEHPLPKLEIGNNVLIGKGDRIGCDYDICIEDDVILAPNVHISDRNHSYMDISLPIRLQPIQTKGPVRIGKGSWLGFGCQIMSGVTIGFTNLY